MSSWQAKNIMNNTIYSLKLNKFIPYNKIKLEKPMPSGESFIKNIINIIISSIKI